MPRMPRAATVERLRAQLARGEPIVGGGAGTGLSAKAEEAGGIDLIVVYNSGRYRMAGRGSSAGLMPYGDANAVVLELAGEVLPVVERTPVLADAPGLVDAWAEPALARRQDLLVLVHGGPVATPEDARLDLAGSRRCHGFYGASSIERLPVERAIAQEARRFRSILRPEAGGEQGGKAG